MIRFFLATIVSGALLLPAAAAGLDAAAINGGEYAAKRSADDQTDAAIVKIQVLLDRVRFSPGEIDGKLGENAEKALKAAFGDRLRLTPANTTSEDFSEFANAVPSMMFNIGVYEPEQWTAANKSGTPLAANHSPQFAPVPKPTILTGVTAMTLAVLSAFDQHARGK